MNECCRPLARLRALFPVTRERAYFNVAANAPLADPVRAAVDTYLADLARHGSLHYRDWFAAADRARAQAARLLGAETGEVAFVHSTSEGILTVAQGLGLGAGDSVVLVHGDFPANVHPWLRLRDQGVTIRMVHPDPDGRVPPERIAAACDATTRVASVSFVSFTTGFRMDLGRLAELLHARDVLLCVDAIQGLGAFPLDVRQDGIDFLAADGHTWLLTPEGIGVFFVRAALLPRLRPPSVSWLSMKDPFDVTAYRGELQDDARRFEYATPNTLGIHALEAALGILLEAGVERIARHVLHLTDLLCDGLVARGCCVRSPRGAGESSGIVAFDAPGMAPAELVAALEQRDVLVGLRAGRVRVAVHLYNDAGDVTRLLDALPAPR